MSLRYPGWIGLSLQKKPYNFKEKYSPNSTRQNALFSASGYAIACMRCNCGHKCVKASSDGLWIRSQNYAFMVSKEHLVLEFLSLSEINSSISVSKPFVPCTSVSVTLFWLIRSTCDYHSRKSLLETTSLSVMTFPPRATTLQYFTTDRLSIVDYQWINSLQGILP